MQRALERRILVANAVAVLFVAAYLVTVGRPVLRGGWLVAAAVGLGQAVVLLGLLGFIAIRYSRRFVTGASAWVAEGRQPTPAERRVALRLPWTIGILPLPFWLIAAVVIAAWPQTGDAGDRVRIFVGIALGGILTCTLCYVLVERANSELRALVLAGAAPDEHGAMTLRLRLLVVWALTSGIPFVGIALTPVVRSPQSRVPLGVPIALLALAGIGAGLFATVGLAGSIAEPLDRIRRSLESVQRGDLDAGLTVDAAGEIGMVQAGFNEMVSGLREREQLRDLFGRHVGEEVARAALKQGVSLGGESRTVSVFFVDLIGSSALARETSPDKVVALLNRFFAAVVMAASGEGGWVNKFEGDAALCVFGAPTEQPDHAARALRAARRLRETLDGIEAGIGVSSGTVVAGNVGTEARYEYTVIGHPVNEAARITDEAKRYDTRLLASAAAINAAPEEAANWASRGVVDLRGTGTTEVFEPRA
jgi:adenylate cyclase